MICPRCGSDVSGTLSRCSQCSAPLGPVVATGVLTPPVAIGGDDEATFAGLNKDATLPGSDPASGNRTSEPTPQPENPDEAKTVLARPKVVPGVLNVGQAFGSRYHIISSLGVGGMGAVYQA